MRFDFRRWLDATLKLLGLDRRTALVLFVALALTISLMRLWSHLNGRPIAIRVKADPSKS